LLKRVDFGKTPFKQVKYWALKVMKRFKLKGFVILKSSENHYHVVFDRTVSWKENVKIMAWVSLLSHCKKLLKWFVMQCIKQGSTLRMSPKSNKPSPRIVYRHGKQDSEIKNFLNYRNLAKRIIEKL